jgi:hypothetical protein
MTLELAPRGLRGRAIRLLRAPRPLPARKLLRRPFGFTAPCPTMTLTGLEFSLKRPRWLRKLKVGRILGKVVKVGAVVGGAALLAPAAAGLAVRGAGLVRKVGVLKKVGGKIFRLTAGRKARPGLPFGALRRAAAFKIPLPAYRTPGFGRPNGTTMTIPVPEAAETPQPADFAAMVPSGAGVDQGAPSPGAEETAAAPAGAAGINPALLIGGLVIGGMLLTGMGRKGRAG